MRGIFVYRHFPQRTAEVDAEVRRARPPRTSAFTSAVLRGNPRMIIIQNTVISDDVRDNFFVCNLEACKGACCVEGDLGAPLEEAELRNSRSRNTLTSPPTSPRPAAPPSTQQGVVYRGLGGRLQHPHHQRPGVRLRPLRRARHPQVRHRAGLPGRGHELQEAHQLPPLPHSHHASTTASRP